ncbi:TPA: ead/Ea22-like family protein [Salmonella enterica subsp. enterica serovar Birkenhead]
MNIDKQALREVATVATQGGWYIDYDFDVCHESGAFLAETHGDNLVQNAKFIAAANPATVLALLDELEAEQGYREGAFVACNRWHDKFREEEAKLEAAEKRIAEQSAIVAAAEKLVRCKGRYHSELNYRALAKLFGVITPDLPPLEHENVHYADAAEVEITALRQRIAELEKGHQEAAKQINSWRRLAKQNIAERGKDISELEAARQRITELESKLSNPVLLPKTNGYWNEQEKAYEEAITLAKRRIRMAGFRCEGDE